jgi:hypothetical protein
MTLPQIADNLNAIAKRLIMLQVFAHTAADSCPKSTDFDATLVLLGELETRFLREKDVVNQLFAAITACQERA